MNRPIKGLMLGVVVAVILVAAISLFAGTRDSVWWWPAVLVFGAIGGAVIGALLGEEAAGEAPEERYVDPE